MYNLRSSSGGCEEFVPILTELNSLIYLDISDDRDNPLDMLTPLQDCTTQILKQPQCFTRLTSLDLSGKDGIDIKELKRFISYKQQKNCESLKFLGLMQTSLRDEELVFNDSELVITGNATESQIIESLRRYKLRPTFVQKSLFHLYNYTSNYSEPRTDLIHLIIIPMKRHSKIIGIQMAATACLYNLTKNKLGEKIHPKILKNVVEATLQAMEQFPNHQQLQKNALLTLCSDRILQDVSFNRYKCTQLVMDSLVGFKDTAMNRMAVAICSILAAKISTTETSNLGAKPIYMETLLDIVRSRVQYASDHDIMLKFTLSALWNLTDESPKTCEMFLEKGGMDLYLTVLNVSFESLLFSIHI
jgi:Zyg-11 family protein